MELHSPCPTEIKFINDEKFSKDQIEGAKNFLLTLFKDDNALYKKGVTDGTVVIKGGREGTIVYNREDGITYRLMGKCIGNVVYVEDMQK